MDDDRRLVYSSDGGWVEPAPRSGARPAGKALPAHPDDGIVRVARERRRASAVTIVTGLAAAQIQSIGKELRRLCGAGGTVKDGRIEIQGDHRDRILRFFEVRGVRAKRAGG